MGQELLIVLAGTVPDALAQAAGQPRSAGKKIDFAGKTHTVEELDQGLV